MFRFEHRGDVDRKFADDEDLEQEDVEPEIAPGKINRYRPPPTRRSARRTRPVRRVGSPQKRRVRRGGRGGSGRLDELAVIDDLDTLAKRPVSSDQTEAASSTRAQDFARARVALRATAAGGERLPAALMTQMGRLLGAELGGVRIHRGAAANAAAAQLDAVAFTSGSDIAFAAGAYDPESAAGRLLLAHELVHAVQQQRAGTDMAMAARSVIGTSGSAVEAEADAGAASIVAGRPFQVRRHAALPLISRRGDPPTAPDAGAPDAGAPDAGAGSPDAGAGSTPDAVAGANANSDAGTAADAGGTSPPGGAPQPAQGGQAAQRDGQQPPATGGQRDKQGQGQQTPSSDAAGQGQSGQKQKPGEGITSSPDYECKLDARVQEILNQRADPSHKKDYKQLIGSADALRIASLQYNFTPPGFGHALLQAHWPSDAIGSAWDKAFSNNAYASGQGGLAKLQTFIEGARGVVKIIGEISGAVSAIAGTVEILGAAATAIAAAVSGPGAVIPGAITEIAAAVSLAAAIVQAIATLIDTLLGILQMLLLVYRAKHTKDPAERARICALLKKEADELGGNVVTLGIQAVGVAAAAYGAGGEVKAIGKEMAQASKLLRPSTAREAFKAAKEAGIEAAKEAMPKTAKAAVAKELAVLEAHAALAPSKAAEDALLIARFTKETTLDRLLAETKLARRAMIVKSVRSAVQSYTPLPTSGTGIITKGLSATKQAAGKQSALKGSSPTKPKHAQADNTERLNLILGRVTYWPEILGEMNDQRKDIHDAQMRMKEQHKTAKEEAGGKNAAAVQKVFGTIEVSGNRIKATGIAKKQEAMAQQAQARKGRSHVKAAKKPVGKLAGKKKDFKKSVDKVKGQANRAKSGYEASKNDDSWNPITWAMNKLGSGLGKVQKWISDMALKQALAWAGMNEKDLDLAGMDKGLLKDEETDKKSHAEASAAAGKGDTIKAGVKTLKKGLDDEEAAAVQAMVDTTQWINALDQFDQALATEIVRGEGYTSQAALVIAREMAKRDSHDAIDANYIKPIITAGTMFVASTKGRDATLKQAGKTAVDHMMSTLQSIVPGCSFSKAETAGNQMVSSSAKKLAKLSKDAVHDAELTMGASGMLIGTTKYDVVGAAARSIEDTINNYRAAEKALIMDLQHRLQGLIDQYEKVVRDTVADKSLAGDQPPQDAD